MRASVWRIARDDRGNAVVEAAILLPLFIAFLAALLIGDRIRHASAAVTQAAADAARQASIARTPHQARTDATASARTTLRQAGLHCAPQVAVDVSGFSRPVGQSATITARVTCTERLSEIALPGMPGSRTVTKLHRSVLDPYRGRG
jgi:Flp pilus assembly protein TadG